MARAAQGAWAKVMRLFLLCAVWALSGCASRRAEPEVRVASEPRAAEWTQCTGATRSAQSARRLFARSRGGALEIDGPSLAAQHCNVRVVDVRERDEIEGELGRIAGSEWVVLNEIEERAAQWNREEPLVIVCRSGRRSARAAEQLEALGFRSVASLTGGMLEWKRLQLPVERGALVDAPPSATTTVTNEAVRDGGATLPDAATAVNAASRPVDVASLLERLSRPGAVRWTTAASILSAGTESCIDGRSAEPVFGTPGGDVGELLLSLAALEQHTGRAVSEDALDALLTDHADSFGRIYLHTDEHTLDRLQLALARDERVPTPHRPRDRASALALIRHPPREAEAALLDLATRAEHVGCGHLRAMIEHPADYQTSERLVRATLRSVLRLAWRRPESVDLHVLEGEHHEHAVLRVLVRGARGVRAHSRVPMLAPSVVGDGVFMLHPQVQSFVRAESAGFLAEHAASLVGAPVSEAAFAARVTRLGEAQTRQTLARLAARLPSFTVVLDPHESPVVRAD